MLTLRIADKAPGRSTLGRGPMRGPKAPGPEPIAVHERVGPKVPRPELASPVPRCWAPVGAS
eukprot:4295607-Pyramimonas_sp.AAC.1